MIARRTPLRRTSFRRRPRPVAKPTRAQLVADIEAAISEPAPASSPPRKRSKYADRPRNVPYMLFVKSLPCCAKAISADHPCSGPIEADHAGKHPGMDWKAADETTIPLCTYHHRCRHDFAGPFRSWIGEHMRAWLDHWIRITQALARAKGIPMEATT